MEHNIFIGLKRNQVKEISCSNSVIRVKNGLVHLILKEGNVESVYFLIITS